MSANILIVDDIPENLKLLVNVLSKKKLKTRPIRSGKLAIASAFEMPPDLILLDIKLPDIDGYEVCRILKEDKRTTNIPIIFISALNDIFDKVKGFSAGGVDYITKPFEEMEVIARIENHLAICNLQKKLNKKNKHLKNEIAAHKKTMVKLKKSKQKLVELNSAKDKFFSLMAHDLKNSFISFISFSELIKTEYNDYSLEEKQEFIHHICESSKHGYNLLENLLEWASIQMNRLNIEPININLHLLIDSNILLLNTFAETKQIKINYTNTDKIYVFADGNMINTVIRNLLSNAIKFTPQKGTIHIDIKIETSQIKIFIIDNGVGISENHIESLFHIETNRSTLGTNKEKGTGLGLILCKEFIKKNNGEIGVTSKVGQGTTFWFTLPKSK